MPVRFQGDTSVYRSLTLDSLMDSLGKERLVLLLCLVSSLSLAYRDGASTESCYGHEIVHLSFGQPVPKLDCSGSCQYDLDFIGRVDENLQPAADNYSHRIECDNIYNFRLTPASDIGYLIQARTNTKELDVNSTIWGEWIMPNTSYSKILMCKRSAHSDDPTLYPNSITHSDVFDGVPSLDAYWRAPSIATIYDYFAANGDLPQIKFFYTIVTGLNTNYYPISTPNYTIECPSAALTTSPPINYDTTTDTSNSLSTEPSTNSSILTTDPSTNSSTNISTTDPATNSSTNISTTDPATNSSTNTSTTDPATNSSTNILTSDPSTNSSTNTSTTDPSTNSSTNTSTTDPATNSSTNTSTTEQPTELISTYSSIDASTIQSTESSTDASTIQSTELPTELISTNSSTDASTIQSTESSTDASTIQSTELPTELISTNSSIIQYPSTNIPSTNPSTGPSTIMVAFTEQASGDLPTTNNGLLEITLVFLASTHLIMI